MSKGILDSSDDEHSEVNEGLEEGSRNSAEPDSVEDEAFERFDVRLTDEAFYALATLSSDRVFARMGNDLELLGLFPHLGREYDPVYDAARPPFACRVFHCENFGIYYRVDDEERRVVVFAIVDQRRNPVERFSDFERGAE